MERALKVSWWRIIVFTLAMLALIVILVRNLAPISLDMRSEAWAAWVQAVGSVVAILVAVAIPVFLERLKMRREDQLLRLRARARALEILSDLQELVSRAEHLIDMYEEPQWAPTADVMRLLTPSRALREAIPYSHEFGNASEPLQDCLAVLIQAKDAYVFFHEMKEDGHDLGDSALDEVGRSIRTVRSSARLAIERINYFFLK